jgi:hypothetical protein
MNFRDGLVQARSQIAFILALILSTAAIVYLERSDQDTLTMTAEDRRIALAQLSAARMGMPSRDPDRLADLLVALVTAHKAGAAPASEISRDLESILTEAGKTPSSAKLRGAMLLAGMTFPHLRTQIAQAVTRR